MNGKTNEPDAISLSKAFFEEVVRPAMEKTCPAVLDKAACGRFGWGSECFGMDDAISRDHHWGPRIDLLLPDRVFRDTPDELWEKVSRYFPGEFRGFKLEPGHVGGAGLAPESMDEFLLRTIGRTTAPESNEDWLGIPEEDILHVINGEVWHDGAGQFSHIRDVLGAYYPDEVWRRRLANWCRYASGMGLYALHRALLRENRAYAHTTLARTLKLSLELAFMLNRRYFPYDKWLYPTFRKLPELAPDMLPLVDELTENGTAWPRRVELLEAMHDILDAKMVGLGLVRPHPKFKRSATSGYRLLEWCYYDLLKGLPRATYPLVPIMEQRFMEQWVVEYVAGLGDDEWRHLLCLEPEEG